jgi:hypothetical protein
MTTEDLKVPLLSILDAKTSVECRTIFMQIFLLILDFSESYENLNSSIDTLDPFLKILPEILDQSRNNPIENQLIISCILKQMMKNNTVIPDILTKCLDLLINIHREHEYIRLLIEFIFAYVCYDRQYSKTIRNKIQKSKNKFVNWDVIQNPNAHSFDKFLNIWSNPPSRSK